MQPLTVQIDGMTCGHCVEQVTKVLKGLKNVHVHSVEVGKATVSFDSHQMSGMPSLRGYDLSVTKPGGTVHQNLERKK